MNTNDEKFIREEMGKLLLKMGIFPSAKGYFAIIQCVYESINYGTFPVKMHDIYNIAGRALGRNGAAIEHSIRVSLTKSLHEAKAHVVNEYFDCEICSNEYYVRSGEFISLCAHKLCNDIKNSIFTPTK